MIQIKLQKFFINDIDGNSENSIFDSGLSGQLLGKIKNVNYETVFVSNYKDDNTSELFEL